MREDKDIRQSYMANYLNVHQTGYSSYELGHANIPIPILIKIVKFHNTSIDYFVGLTDIREPHPQKYDIE